MDQLISAALQAAFSPEHDSVRLNPGFFRVLLARCLELTGAKEGGILTVAENRHSMRIEAWEGTGVNSKSRILPLGSPPENICARCAQQGKAERIPDVSLDSQFRAQSKSTIRSQLTVPVRFNNETVGIFNVESEAIDFFTPEHLASVLALAQETAPLWIFVTTAFRESRQRALIKALRQVSQSLLTTDSHEKTLQLILDESLRLTNSDLGGVCLLGPDKETLIVKPAKGLSFDPNEPPQIPKPKGFTWRSIMEGKPQNVPDVTEHPTIYHKLPGDDVLALLCVPMFVGMEPIGALNMESAELNHFSLLDEEILTAFAFQAAIAVKLIEMRGQFAAANALAALGSLSGNLTHTINNSVGGIRVLGAMLARKLQPISPELSGMADEIHTAATQTLATVEHYEELFSLDEKQFAINEVITSALAAIKPPTGITVMPNLCQPSPFIVASSSAFSEIVTELTRNAIKALVTNGSIEVATRQTVHHVAVLVSDDGKTISADKAARMFERGTSDRPHRVGTGFGLWWIDQYMCKLGGSVRHIPVMPVGNSFELLFPLNRRNVDSDHHEKS